MKYVMLQTNIGEQIKIVDNSTYLGKKTVESLCLKGYKPIGYIESEQRPSTLIRGFSRNINDKLGQKLQKLWNIRKVLDDEPIIEDKPEEPEE